MGTDMANIIPPRWERFSANQVTFPQHNLRLPPEYSSALVDLATEFRISPAMLARVIILSVLSGETVNLTSLKVDSRRR